jgi:hypothetical protein
MSEFVEEVAHAVFAAVVGAVLGEVIRPDVVGLLWPQPDTGAVHEPKTAAFRLLLGAVRPSRFQIRSTRPSLTDQPAWRSRAVILR